MELSTAILKGCEIRPNQGKNTYFDNTRGKLVSCVLGAAYEGLYGSILHDSSYWLGLTNVGSKLHRSFPILDQKTIFDGDYTVKTWMICANDTLGWTREQIAAWVKYVVEGAPMIPEEENCE